MSVIEQLDKIYLSLRKGKSLKQSTIDNMIRDIDLYKSPRRSVTKLLNKMKRCLTCCSCVSSFKDLLCDLKKEIRKKKIIYLANNMGFSEQQKEILLPIIKEELESLGLEVWEPFERNNQDVTSSGWAYRTGQGDLSDTRNSDAIFVILNGVPSDEGAMIELGYAMADRKSVV